MKEENKKNLVNIINENKGCTAIIDNDDWWIVDKDGNELANASDVEILGDGWYGSGCCYGGDVLQALAKIVGINIKSV